MRTIIKFLLPLTAILIFCSAVSAQPYSGTLVGSPAFGAAKFSNGLTATSDSNNVAVPVGVFNFGATDSWTIEAWLKTTSSSGIQVAVSTGNSGDPNGIWMGISTNNVHVNVPNVGGGGFLDIDSGVLINDGAWHHCALVMSAGTSVKLFVDGVLASTTAANYAVQSHTNGVIGRFSIATSFGWSGSIDEVVVWKTNKYTTNFTPPSSAYVGTEAHIHALYHLDNNATDIAIVPSMTATPFAIVISTTGNVVTLIGSNVTWTAGTPGTPTFTLSGGTGASIVVQTVMDATHAQITVTAGSALGPLTITDPGSGATTTVTVTVNVTTIAMNDTHIIYSPFNWNVDITGAKTVNPGAYFRVIFSGTFVEISTDTSMDSGALPLLWARIDGGAYQLVNMVAESPTLTIASGLSNTKHLLEILVRAASQEANVPRWASPASMVSITSIILDASSSVALPVRRSKNILIYGDSITEGDRVLGIGSPHDVNGNDALGCYSHEIGEGLDAEVGVVAFGGHAVNAPNANGVPALTGSYNFIYGGVSRSFNSPAPDLIIYNEGTNDGGSITTNLTTVVNALLIAAPSAKQLILVPFNGGHSTEVAAVVTAVNNANVTSQSTTGWWNSADSADGLHPYAYSSVGLIAPKLIQAAELLLYPGSCFRHTLPSQIVVPEDMSYHISAMDVIAHRRRQFMKAAIVSLF